jgi:hypothetical protein
MNENDTITKIIAHKAFRLTLEMLLLAMIVFALFYCNSNPQSINDPIVDTNPLNEIVQDKDAIIFATMENNKVLRAKLDSASKVKPKVIIRYKTVYDSLLVADTACINSLVTLYNQCAKVDSMNEYIIANQSNQIAGLITVTNNQNDIIDIRNYQHGVDSVNEVKYKEQIQDEIKNGKRKYRKGLLQGGVVGLGVGFIGGLILLK